MGIVREPELVKLFVGVLAGRQEWLARVERDLAGKYGAILHRSPLFAFACTDYYEPQMGPELKRRFYSFEVPFEPERLWELKLETNAYESGFEAAPREGVARPVNCDPGYVTPAKVVLATTKNRSHRVYLKKGIYAEVTLRFEKGTYAAWPWTYPDYRWPGTIRFFNEVRTRWLQRQA